MSILISVIILAVVVAVIALIGPRVTATLNAKTNMIIVSAYTGILLLLSVIALLIPASTLRQPIESVTDNNSISQELATNMANGHFDPPQGVTRKEISYQISGKSIEVSGEMPGMVYVGVKGQDVPDNGNSLIEVYSYATSTVLFHDTSYPIAINQPECILADGSDPKLTVSPSKTREDVAIRQFDDIQTLSSLDDSSSSGCGLYTDAAVIILLPPGVTWTAVSAEPISTLLHNSAAKQ